MNLVVLKGNLTKDPELHYTQGGTACGTISIAVNKKWKDKDGASKEEVSYFDIVAWGKLAENVAQYLKKGRQALVQGQLKQDRWEDKETGAKRYAVKVIADSIEFIGGKAEADASGVEAEVASEAEEKPEVKDTTKIKAPF